MWEPYNGARVWRLCSGCIGEVTAPCANGGDTWKAYVPGRQRLESIHPSSAATELTGNNRAPYMGMLMSLPVVRRRLPAQRARRRPRALGQRRPGYALAWGKSPSRFGLSTPVHRFYIFRDTTPLSHAIGHAGAALLMSRQTLEQTFCTSLLCFRGFPCSVEMPRCEMPSRTHISRPPWSSPCTEPSEEISHVAFIQLPNSKQSAHGHPAATDRASRPLHFPADTVTVVQAFPSKVLTVRHPADAISLCPSCHLPFNLAITSWLLRTRIYLVFATMLLSFVKFPVSRAVPKSRLIYSTVRPRPPGRYPTNASSKHRWRHACFQWLGRI